MRFTLPGSVIPNRLTFIVMVIAANVIHAEQTKPANDIHFQSTADVGVESIDDDLFVSLLFRQDAQIHGFSFALAAPLRLRAHDNAPADTGVLRQQDWDTLSDFARIVPYIAYQQLWDEGFVDLYAGPLNGIRLGHGSVANFYFNSTDMDQYRAGPLLRGEWGGNGLEFAMNDILAPEQFILRPYVAPLAWFMDGDWPRRFTIGYTLGIDAKAPYRINGDGSAVILVTGGDISLRIVDASWGRVTPYVELLAMDGDLGIHAGAETNWILSEKKDISFQLQGEYRRSGSDYHPGVFNPFYEHNRLSYAVTDPDEALTFADQLRDSESLAKGHGFMFDAAFQLSHRFRIGGHYDTEGIGRHHWVMFRLELEPFTGYHVNLFYGGQDIRGGNRLFGWNALFGAAARARIYKPVDLFFQFTRRLRRQNDTHRYANEFGGGFGAAITY